MHPARDTLQRVMVESGVTEGERNTASFLFREWTQQVRMSYSLQSTIVFNTNLCEWQIAHEITYHFVFIMIITCWLLFKPDNHSHNIFQEKEGVYSTDDHKAFPQISQFSIMSMKTKCLTEGVRGRKNIFNNNSVKSYLALKWHLVFFPRISTLRLLYSWKLWS